MKDATRVHVLQASEDLIKEELDVLVTENLVRLNDLRQVCFHQISHHVQLVELLQ
jgi:hypothetical protein